MANVELLQAEIARLRAEVAEWKRVAAAQAELHDEAERCADALDEREARAWPDVAGIGRDSEHPRAVVLYLRHEPSDEHLRTIQEALRTRPAQPAVGEEIMVNAAHDVYTLPLQPSGLDGSGPRFVVHVPARPAPDVSALVDALEKARAFIGGQPVRTETVGKSVYLREELGKVMRVMSTIDAAIDAALAKVGDA